MAPRKRGKKSEGAGADRRKSPRIRMVTQVESRGAKKSSLGHTEDLSEGGLLIVTPETLERETEISIRFNLPPVPPGRPVEGKGVVVRVQPGVNMGVQFQVLKEDDRKAIEKLVRRTPEA